MACSYSRIALIALVASSTAFIRPLRHISPIPALRQIRAATPDDADLQALTREDLEEEVLRLRRENAALRKRIDAPARTSFSLKTAALCAGFAFECYNDPAGARWERGADGCDGAPHGGRCSVLPRPERALDPGPEAGRSAGGPSARSPPLASASATSGAQ